MATSAQSFVSTMLNVFILLMFLPLIASQCMDYRGMKRCSFRLNVETKDLLQCMDDCQVKPGETCQFIRWKPETKQCHVATDATFLLTKGSCAMFRKAPCDNIPGKQSLQDDSGNIFKGGQQMTCVTSLEECRAIFAIDGISLAFTWLSERRRCVVLNPGGNSHKGILAKDVNSLLSLCVETVLNTSSWTWYERACWSHDSLRKTLFNPVERMMQLRIRKRRGCRLWQRTNPHATSLCKTILEPRNGSSSINIAEFTSDHDENLFENSMIAAETFILKICGAKIAVPLQKHENTKMSGGLKLKDLSKQVCLELCQLVSNCAALGWSDSLRECTFHLLNLSTEEDPSSTLYMTSGAGITTSTTTVSPIPVITTTSTSTEATTAAPMDGTGTYLGAFFIRRDNNLLIARSQRRAALECAMLCLHRHCSDFTSGILNNDSVCGMSGSEPTGRFRRMQWIKL